jgi:hypothetical protein
VRTAFRFPFVSYLTKRRSASGGASPRATSSS